MKKPLDLRILDDKQSTYKVVSCMALIQKALTLRIDISGNNFDESVYIA